VVITVFSTNAFGMLLGSIGLRARDVFFISNIVYFVMLLLCGVNVPLEQLPGWMQAVSQALPLTHGIEAARRAVAGEGLGSVGGLVLTELLIGVAYAASAFALFRWLEISGRRTAALDRY
jgi:ABC-2 type transport system permease protein